MDGPQGTRPSPSKGIHSDTSGQAMLEFILVFPTIFFVTLCIMQYSLLLIAEYMVEYAAFCATRAAIVYIPEKMEADGSQPEEAEWELIVNTSESGYIDFWNSGKKICMINQAARIPLITISKGLTDMLFNLEEGGVGLGSIQSDYVDTLGDLGVMGDAISLADRFAYTYFFTRALPTGEGEDTGETSIGESFKKYKYTFTQAEPIAIRVTYKYYLGIPIANAVFGRSMGWNLADELSGYLSDISSYVDTSEFTDALSDFGFSFGYYRDIAHTSTLINPIYKHEIKEDDPGVLKDFLTSFF